MTAPPRYLRATLVSTLAAVLVAVAIVAMGFLQPPEEASEAQGAFIVLTHQVVALLFICVAFPIAGWRLYHRGMLTGRRFYKTLLLALIGVSLLPAAALALVGFGIRALGLAPLSFAALAVLSLPFSPLWLRLAR